MKKNGSLGKKHFLLSEAFYTKFQQIFKNLLLNKLVKTFL